MRRIAALLRGLLALAAGAGGWGCSSPAAAPTVPVAGVPTVVFLGDSLTDGFGLPLEVTYPARLEALLAGRGLAIRAVNAGKSGDTAAQGHARLGPYLAARPEVVVVALGINDGFRGLPLADLEAELRAMAAEARAAGARVLLVGMELPAEVPEAARRDFAAVYARVAADLRLPLVPSLLAGVLGVRELNKKDGIHPNEQGHAVMAQTLLPWVEAEVRALPR